jgi:hypothetical protein
MTRAQVEAPLRDVILHRRLPTNQVLTVLVAAIGHRRAVYR